MKDRAVLCVDDEKNILMALKRLLRKEEYRVFTAESGQEGLALLEKEPVQLVLSDQRMPEMTGIEFLQKVKGLYPDTIRVVLSGYADAHTIVESINEGEIYRFLGKPWNDDELKAIIRQCFEHYDILKQNNELMEQTRIQNEKLRELNEGLEEIVEERTQFLQLAQEILEHLPAPVIGIGADGMIVLTNEAARDAIHSLVPGTDMDEALPSDVAEAASKNMRNGSSGEISKLEWEGRLMNVHIRVLKRGDVVRGCLLMLEAI